MRAPVLPVVLLALSLAAGCSGDGPTLTRKDASPTVASSSSSALRAGAPSPSTVASTSATPSQSPGVPMPAHVPELKWTACGDGFSCSTLRVPLDYTAPGEGSMELAVIRKPATSRSERIGSLVVNPGGPGASAVSYLRNWATGDAVPSLRRRFDLVAFDPRGVGKSAPVRCLSTRELDVFYDVDPEPDTPAEHDQIAKENTRFRLGCRSRAGRVLPHVGTVNVARDMELLRRALHDDKLTYLGYSYGTALGASYLDQFPTHVRAMVLDGALDPRLSWDQLSAGQALGFDAAFQSFLRWCDSHADTCEFRRVTTGDLGKAYDQIAARVERGPLDTAETRGLGPAELSFGTGLALYSTGYWETLGSALTDAKNGDGTALLRLSDLYLDRSENGYLNTLEANYAVNCIDRPWPEHLEEYAELADKVRADAPRFGPGIAWSGSACGHWPAPPTNRPHAVTGTGSPPILVIGTTRDPATPYAWAVALADQLDKGVLITVDGDGHTAYHGGRSSCVVDRATSYLLTAKAPSPARC